MRNLLGYEIRILKSSGSLVINKINGLVCDSHRDQENVKEVYSIMREGVQEALDMGTK